MNVIAFILFLIAAVLFLVGDRTARYMPGSNLAMFCLTVGFIFQFCAETHQVTF